MFGGTIRLQVADLVAEFLQFAAELIQFILERGDGIGTIVITGSLAFRTPGFGLEAADFRLGLGGHFSICFLFCTSFLDPVEAGFFWF